MKRILIFVAGALFGAALVFYWVSTRFPVPVVEHVPKSAPPAAVPPPRPPVVTAPSPPPAPPVAAPSPPAPIPDLPPAATEVPAAQPAAAPLLIQVKGIEARQLSDTYNESRGAGRPHEAIDIVAPRGTPVIAVADGKVVKLFNSKPGGLTVYQFDLDEKLAYYYAHLDSYAPGLAEGQQLKRGELVGYVGTSGNANPATPHLHFAIFVLSPEKRWWKGTAINPYPLLTGR